ncbi:MAG: hypothetical protein MI757_15440, partial [Pirellulales bacterium]|nr:hypothetical protein [Pirellulales bacterium]
MNIYEIRDPVEARRHLLQSVWLSGVVPANPESLWPALEWASEIATEHHPLPLLGFVADVGHLATGTLQSASDDARRDIEGLDPALLRRYEDYVVGKIYADFSIERGADAVLRYQGRDRARAMAYLIHRMCDRADLGGVILVPTVIKQLQQEAEQSPDALLAEGWESIQQDGLSTQIIEDFEEIVTAVRNIGEALGGEDIFELEHGTALRQFGQRLALRQVIRAAERIQRQLPREKLRPMVRRQQVVTNIIEEDLYPIGGYTSISTKGTLESLLHSQLAYMDRDTRPDLF